MLIVIIILLFVIYCFHMISFLLKNSPVFGGKNKLNLWPKLLFVRNRKACLVQMCDNVIIGNDHASNTVKCS